jgi:hypothetical protein
LTTAERTARRIAENKAIEQRAIEAEAALLERAAVRATAAAERHVRTNRPTFDSSEKVFAHLLSLDTQLGELARFLSVDRPMTCVEIEESSIGIRVRSLAALLSVARRAEFVVAVGHGECGARQFVLNREPPIDAFEKYDEVGRESRRSGHENWLELAWKRALARGIDPGHRPNDFDEKAEVLIDALLAVIDGRGGIGDEAEEETLS